MQCSVPCNRIPFSLSVVMSQVPDSAAGVYAFWYGRYCIYVGKTEKQSLRQRLIDHWEGSHNARLRDWIKAKRADLRVSFMPLTAIKEIAVYERYYIKRLQPLANKVMFKSKK